MSRRNSVTALGASAFLATVSLLCLVSCLGLLDGNKAADTWTVAFDLNYPGATGAPSSRTVVDGGYLTEPPAPARDGYYFDGWYREGGLARIWDFDTDTVTSFITLYAKWNESTSAGSTLSSIRFASTKYNSNKDYVGLSSGPVGGGTLFTIWSKAQSPGSFPYAYHNLVMYRLFGGNWKMAGLVDNMTVDSIIDDSVTGWNANTMLWANSQYVGDYTLYFAPENCVTASQALGWVWTAVQMVSDDSAGMLTLRQWVMFGRNGDVFKLPESKVSYAAIRTNIGDSVWMPSGNITGFSIGQTDEANTASAYHCVNAKMFARATEPTLAELKAIALNTSPDSSAWGDWLLNWESGAPNLADRSGHGRDLVPAGSLSALYQGDSLYIGD